MRLSNRTYTSGFYSRNPRQYGENQEDGYSAGLGESVCGVVETYDPETGLAEIEVKNRFLPGQEITLITPDKDTVFTLDAIMDKHGTKLEAAHGGARNVWVSLPEDPGEIAFLRLKLDF
jgi:putative protease